MEGIGKVNGRKLQDDSWLGKPCRSLLDQRCRERISDLLEYSGVDTVKELALRKSANLHKKKTQVNKKKKLVRQLPSEKMVGNWVKQAKKLKRVVKY